MVPEHPLEKQPGFLPQAHNDHDSTARCPTCGRLAFGPHSSALLDLLLEAHDTLTRAKATLEAVVLP
jgi:hypothetical protein